MHDLYMYYRNRSQVKLKRKGVIETLSILFICFYVYIIVKDITKYLKQNYINLN